MGTDKAVLVVDGRAMARRVADALLAAGAQRVVALGGDRAALEALDLAVVDDADPGAGPFPAVVQAVAAPGSPIVLVLGCDLVAPDPTVLQRLVAALAREPDAVGAVPVVDGREQWVHAAWRRSAVAQLRAAWAEGHRSLHRAAGSLRLVRVDGIDAAVVADADSPVDLVERARSGDRGEG